MERDAEWRYMMEEVDKIKDELDELGQRLQVLSTVVEATMEQMSDLMDMMVQAVPSKTPPRTFSENIFSQEC